MKRIIAGLLGASLTLIFCGAADAQSSPRISGQVSAPECRDAMSLAKHMYASNSIFLYAPLQISDHMESTLIQGATDVDISGGDALPDTSGHFENPFSELTGATYPHVHWGKDVSNAGRLVVVAGSLGWRGDVYSLYALKGNITPEQFRGDLADTNQLHRYRPLVYNAWRPPLVFWSEITGKPWFIDVGDTYERIGRWDVYLAGSNGYKDACQINFWRDQGRAQAPLVLPNEVRVLASLLDQTLGYGPEQGTLQPTATLRSYSRHVWRNVAYRPWTLSDKDTYNSKDQVDDGLLLWSKTGPSYAHSYARIQRTYPLAESALARYYKSEFKLSKEQAKKVAHWVLDVAYRSNFVFSGGTPVFQGKDTVANPWISP
ncbi:MAG: hypothetical protein ABI268_02700 [Rhodanobacter sp.]